MRLNNIKVGKWYDTDLGVGLVQKVGPLQFARMEFRQYGVRLLRAREVKAETTAPCYCAGDGFDPDKPCPAHPGDAQ